ncbi:hypothetical protein [Streptomyces swartbergensis]|uniref:hypothetical protein n=1 Tax=Streptomyces swartbergensis TaxID=487165 RepID=UPI00382F742C
MTPAVPHPCPARVRDNPDERQHEVTTPPAHVPAAAAASASASEDRYARYRFSLHSGTGAAQTLAQWLPLAAVWATATNSAFPGTTRRSEPGTPEHQHLSRERTRPPGPWPGSRSILKPGAASQLRYSSRQKVS